MDKVSKAQKRHLGIMIGCLAVIVLTFTGGLDKFTCRQFRNVGFVNMMKGLTHSDSEKLSRAESALLSSEKINDKCAIYGLALLAMHENQDELAISLWEQIIQSGGDQRQAMFLLGNTWWHMGNDVQAFQNWRKSDAQVYWTSKADWYRTEGKTEEALRFYQTALQIDPEWDIAQRGLSFIYHEQIGALWEDERFEAAIPLLLLVIDLDPRPWDYVRIGDYARYQGNGEQAFRWYSQGKTIFPNVVFYPLRMGQIALDDDDWSAAEAYFIEAIQIDATNAEAYLWLGMAYLEQGEFIQAEKAFLTKNELMPDKWGYARLGDVYIAQGRTQDAEKAYQKSLTISPEFDYALKQLQLLQP